MSSIPPSEPSRPFPYRLLLTLPPPKTPSPHPSPRNILSNPLTESTDSQEPMTPMDESAVDTLTD